MCKTGLLAPGTGPSRPAVCKTAFPAPGTGLRTFCRQAASSGRDSVRCAHSGPSQRLLRPRYARTCIRRAPPPARVRGWTRPLAAASCRLPLSRVQNGPSCPRDRPAAASRVQNRPLCPRGLPAAASRVQKGPSCPRERPVAASRVQIGPLCPRERPAAAANTSPADFILVIRELLLSLCPC